MQKLLDKGADPEKKNSEGDSPLDDGQEYECEACVAVMEAELKRRRPPTPEPEKTREEREAELARKHKISSNKLKEPPRKTWQEKMEDSKREQERRRGHQLGLMPWEIDRAEKMGIKMEDFDDIGQYND